MLRCKEVRLLRFARGKGVLRAHFCSNEAPAATPTPSSSPFSSSNPPTRPSHIIYHLLRAKGPLTRKQIEEELSALGMFDLTGHSARRRLLNNKSAVAQTNRMSLPSKPTAVPRSKLQPLLPDTKQQQTPSDKKVLTSKRASETQILEFLQPTPEFKQIAKVRRELAFPSTTRLNAVLNHLKRKGKLETKPEAGQAVRGRRMFAFRIKEGSVPLLTPDEFAASGRKEIMEARTAKHLEIRDARIAEKKEAWASYINGDEHRISTLIDPRVIQAREEARKTNMLGLKA
jgi:hypothetical protein